MEAHSVSVATFILRTPTDRYWAIRAVERAKDGMQVRVSKPDRTREQNAALHACLADIADQLPWPKDTGEIHDLTWWKRRLCLAWLKETRQEVEIITSLEGEEFALLLPHTSDLKVDQHASLREFVLAFGATNGVKFKEPDERPLPPTEAYE